MTLNEMRYIVTVANEKSFSKAAEILFMSQPSLSQAVQRVENSYNCKFFIRTSKGLEITEAGQLYTLLAKDILERSDKMQVELRQFANKANQAISIGMLHNLGDYFLPQALPEFRKKYPNIKVNAIEAQNAELERRLQNGEFGFILTHLPIVGPNIEIITLGSERFTLIVHKDSPLAKKGYHVEGYDAPFLDLRLAAEEPFILFPKTEQLRDIIDMIFSKAGFFPKEYTEIRGLTVHEKLCACGLAVSIIPKAVTLAIGNNPNVVYFNIPDNFHVPQTLVIASLRGKALSPPEEEFRRLIIENNIFTMEKPVSL